MAAAWGLREVHAIIHRFIRGIAMDVFPTKIALSRRTGFSREGARG
jgi:hypothetical protein